MYPSAYQSVGHKALGTEPASEWCGSTAGVDGKRDRQIPSAAIRRELHMPASIAASDRIEVSWCK
jgi:hypothetical protein